MAAPRPSLPPRYAVQDLVAHGGWRRLSGRRQRLGPTVAIKVLAERYARQEEFRKRFLRKARTATTLTGEPNVVAIYEWERHDGLPFIVMKYVPDGRSRPARLRARAADLAMRWLGRPQPLSTRRTPGNRPSRRQPANLLVSATETCSRTSASRAPPETTRSPPRGRCSGRRLDGGAPRGKLPPPRPTVTRSPASRSSSHRQHRSHGKRWRRRPPRTRTAAAAGRRPGGTARGARRGVRPRAREAPFGPAADLRCAGRGPPRGPRRGRHAHDPGRAPDAPDPAADRPAPLRPLPGGAPGRGGCASRLRGGARVGAHEPGGDSGTATVVVTQTSQGRTIERTVTESDTVVVTETAADAVQGDAGSAPAGQSGEELNGPRLPPAPAGRPGERRPRPGIGGRTPAGSSSLAEA